MDDSRKPKPLGQPVLVGKMAYQIYSRVWDGRIRYLAKVGRPFVSKGTGQMEIIAELEDHAAADFLLAARMAKKQLRQLATQAFQQRLQEQQATFAKECPQPEPGIVAAGQKDAPLNGTASSEPT